MLGLGGSAIILFTGEDAHLHGYPAASQHQKSQSTYMGLSQNDMQGL